MENTKNKIKAIFLGVKDPRVVGRCLHQLTDVLFIAFCTLLANGEDYEDMVEFGKQRINWLKTVLDLPNGIPSHDTFNRVFQLLEPSELSKLLAEDGRRLLGSIAEKQLILDGKKLRGENPKSKGNKGLYILNAWIGENKLCIGQRRVDAKSNEITAIPELLEDIEIAGSIVTIDAIGCQKKIAEKIKSKSADYLLSVKKNQKYLYEMIGEAFKDNKAISSDEEWEYDHGRYEERDCEILEASKVWTNDFCEEWEGMKTLVKVKSKRRLGDKTSEETRYYISSEEVKNAVYYNRLARGHWSIENQLHWHLDVTFNEDSCRARRGNAAENLSAMRKVALHRLSYMKDKLSLKKRRFRATLNNNYLLKLLNV
jgi:predicted transposase YbfD/YdcC